MAETGGSNWVDRIGESLRFLSDQYGDVAKDLLEAYAKAAREQSDTQTHNYGDEHENQGHEHDHHHTGFHHHGTGLGYGEILAASGLATAGAQLTRKTNLPYAASVSVNAATAVPMIQSMIRPSLTHAIEGKHIDDMTKQGLTSVLLGAGILGNNHEYTTSAALMEALLSAAGNLSETLQAQQEAAIRELERKIPQEVQKLQADGSWQSIPLNELQLGDRILIPQGRFVPVDGMVTEGRASIDTRFYSGQSRAETVSKGSPVFQGASTLDGILQLKVTALPDESMVSELLHKLRHASPSESETGLSKLVDKYVYFLLAATAGQFAVSAFLDRKKDEKENGNPKSWKKRLKLDRVGDAFKNALELAIKASPCTLLASPLIYPFITTRLAGEHGIFVHNQHALEQTEKLNFLLCDLTGTLTQGEPAVKAIHCFDRDGNSADANPLLASAALLEQQSLHPLAKAIVKAAHGRDLDMVESVEDVNEHAGIGLIGTLNGKKIAAGRQSLIEDANTPLPDALLKQAEALRQDGMSVVFIQHGDQVGVIGLEDELREEALQTVQQLKERNVELAIVTGDHKLRAQKLAAKLGIQHVHADMTPDDKERLVEEYAKSGRIMGMIGDGVNDALAMRKVQEKNAKGQEGIAFAVKGGTSIAEASASMIVETLDQLPQLMDLSRSVNRVAKRNGIAAGAWTALLTTTHFMGLKIGPLLASISHELPTLGLVALASKDSGDLSAKFQSAR